MVWQQVLMAIPIMLRVLRRVPGLLLPLRSTTGTTISMDRHLGWMGGAGIRRRVNTTGVAGPTRTLGALEWLDAGTGAGYTGSGG